MPRSVSIAILMCLVTVPLFARTWRIGPDSGGDQLQAALDRAGKGDVVILANGVYRTVETLRIDAKEEFTLRAELSAVIECEAYIPIVAIEGSTNVTIENLTLYHVSENREPDACGPGASVVDISDSLGVTVRNCELNGSGSVGVNALSSNKLRILDNYIHDNIVAAVVLSMNRARGKPDVVMSGNVIRDNAAPPLFRVLDGWSEVSSVEFDSDRAKIEGLSLKGNVYENNRKDFGRALNETRLIGHWLSEKSKAGFQLRYVFSSDGSCFLESSQPGAASFEGRWDYIGGEGDGVDNRYSYNVQGGQDPFIAFSGLEPGPAKAEGFELFVRFIGEHELVITQTLPAPARTKGAQGAGSGWIVLTRKFLRILE